MQNVHWNLIFNGLKTAIKRFPLVVFAAGSGVIIFILINHNSLHQDFLKRILCVSLIAIPLFVAVQLFSESLEKNQKAKYLSYGFAILFLFLFWYTLPSPESLKFLFIFFPIFAASHLLVSFSGFRNQTLNSTFWNFNVQIFIQFAIAGFYSLVIIAGIEGAFYAVELLFDLNWYEEIYADVFIIVAGLFNTIYWLSKFPDSGNLNTSDLIDPKKIVPLVKYILIPITFLYFIILYLYGIKILIHWNLPKGWLGSLCLGFSLVGFFSYLLNFLLPQYDTARWLFLFKKYFYFLLIPIIALMHISIWKRIHEFGLTESRYFVLLIAFWLLAISLYYIIRRNDDLRYIPISLFIICIISAYGPTSAWNVSVNHQVSRFKKILDKNDLIVNGKLVSQVNDSSGFIKKELVEIIRYLENHKAENKVLKYFPFETQSEQLNAENYSIADTMMKYVDIHSTNLTDYVGGKYVKFMNSWESQLDIQNYSSLQHYRFPKQFPGQKEVKVYNRNSIVIDHLDTLYVTKMMDTQMPGWQERDGYQSNLCLEIPLQARGGLLCIDQITIFIKDNGNREIQNIEFSIFR